MKTKETVETKVVETSIVKTKFKSLRPMPSLMARRSFKPKTIVANMILKTDETEKRA